VALEGWHNLPARHAYIGDVCLVTKVGLRVQHISGGLNLLIERAKSIPEAHLVPGFSTKMLGKRCTVHTKEAHERFLMSKSLIRRLAG
jgi:hypothetical protein